MSDNEMDSGEVIVGTQVQEVTQEVTDQSLIQEEHHGVPFYVWDEDLREDYADRFKLPAYDERGRASSIAVQDERVFRTVATEGIRAMIEASQGQRGSLADVEEFLLLAKKMSSLGAFSMRLSDRTYLMSEENLSRVNPYSSPGQFERLKESALPLRPYQAFAAGAGQDDQGPYMAVVLVHSDAEAAADNIDLLRRRIENTRVIDNSLDWIDVVDDMEIWAEGRALLAKLRGRISIRW